MHAKVFNQVKNRIRQELSPRNRSEGNFDDYVSAGRSSSEYRQEEGSTSPTGNRTSKVFSQFTKRMHRPTSSQNRNSYDAPSHSFNTVDVTIQFVSAWDLPVMDPVGGADPYFKAEIDGRITYTSTAKPSTLTPTWNEVWHIKNVPVTAVLKVHVYDKDEGFLRDDYIGKFKTPIAESGTREIEIESMVTKHRRGVFKLNVISNPCLRPTMPQYTFAGPCRFSRHRSPTVGALTVAATEERLYSTWKIHMIGINEFFGDTWQHWNQNYPAAQSIFAPLSPIKPIIQNAHRLLYARTTANAFGILDRAADFIGLFRDEARDNRIKPSIYTYVIDEDTFRFSETGAAFFVDFASKHALHSKCATEVRYSGEFHWRPAIGGWNNFQEQMDDSSVAWEIVFDNNSGTYAPDKQMLPALRALIEYNFPGLQVLALDREDEELKASTAACRAYGTQHRGIQECEFQPFKKNPQEQTLMHMASVRRK